MSRYLLGLVSKTRRLGSGSWNPDCGCHQVKAYRCGHPVIASRHHWISSLSSQSVKWVESLTPCSNWNSAFQCPESFLVLIWELFTVPSSLLSRDSSSWAMICDKKGHPSPSSCWLNENNLSEAKEKSIIMCCMMMFLLKAYTMVVPSILIKR